MKQTFQKNELEVLDRIIVKVCSVVGVKPTTYTEIQRKNAEKSHGLTIITETEEGLTIESKNEFAVDVLTFCEKCIDKLIPVFGMFSMAGKMFVDQLQSLEIAFYRDVVAKYAPKKAPDEDTINIILDAMKNAGISGINFTEKPISKETVDSIVNDFKTGKVDVDPEKLQ